jgi:PKHD-type hydroxylase
MKYTTIYNDPYNRTKITQPWAYWDGAFTDEELKTIIEYCDAQGVHQSSIMESSDPIEVEKHRVSQTAFHNRSADTAWIFDRLNFIIQSVNEMYYGFDLNGYASFQYTTYDSAREGRYDWHMDMSLGDVSSNADIEPRKLSLSLILNDDYEGGEFQINNGNADDPIILPKIKGRVILFPSFMIHRVTPVTSGRRLSIVVWALGPKFQ